MIWGWSYFATLYFCDFAKFVETESLYFHGFFDKSITKYLPGRLAVGSFAMGNISFYAISFNERSRCLCNRKRCAVPTIAPHPRGGLRIPVTVTAHMESSLKNIQAVERFKSLVELSYKEPVNGNFNDCTSKILKELGADLWRHWISVLRTIIKS